VSERNHNDHTPGADHSSCSKRYRQATAIRYRAHAVDLRALAKTSRLGARRRRILEIAAEFEQLADELEQSSS